jgi:hypothetical protein
MVSSAAQEISVLRPVHSQKAACELLKNRIAKIYDLPTTGPPNLGWWCEFSSNWNPELYVIGLRSGRKCPGMCSNLMGWYAVRKISGEIGVFDINDGSMKPLTTVK